MNLPERAKLLRVLLSPKPTALAPLPRGLACPGETRRAPIKHEAYIPRGTGTGITPHGDYTLRYQAKFISQPDPKLQPRPRAKRRRQGQPVLVTIAEKMPGKLVRAVRTAEELLRK